MASDPQLQMLARMAALDPPPCFMGGWAEDALLAGTVTRPHGDFDWLLPRSELELRRAQAEELGFVNFETWGEAAPGEPFYLFVQSGDFKLELGIADHEDGALWVKVHRLAFDIGGKEAPAGYRARRRGDCARRSSRTSRMRRWSRSSSGYERPGVIMPDSYARITACTRSRNRSFPST